MLFFKPVHGFYFLFFCFLIFFTKPLFAEIGFYQIKDSITPFFVKNTQENVFQILVPGGPLKSLNLKTMTESILSFAQKASKRRWRADIRVPMILAQLENCMELELEHCPYKDGIAVSSAFLIQTSKGRRLISTWHGLKSYLEVFEKLSSKTINSPFALLDSSNNQILKATDTLIQLNPHLQTFDVNGSTVDLDIAIFEAHLLNDRVPLTVAEANEFYGQKYWAIGFPGTTQTRVNQGKPDAEEDTLMWTYGEFISRAGILSRTRHSMFMYGYNSNHPQHNLFNLSTNDAHGGLSGGAVLNEQGELVGMVMAGIFKPGKEDEPPTATIFLNVSLLFLSHSDFF